MTPEPVPLAYLHCCDAAIRVDAGIEARACIETGLKVERTVTCLIKVRNSEGDEEAMVMMPR